jgi:hypothetical protein
MSYETAYIAGLFDGEGCVSSSLVWVEGKYEKYPRIQVQLSITNQDIKCLEFVQEEFGGAIRDKADKKSRCYVWSLTGKRPMKDFLVSLYPYFITKKEQAKEALDFIETLRDQNLGCTPLGSEVHDKRLRIHENLKKLKVIV